MAKNPSDEISRYGRYSQVLGDEQMWSTILAVAKNLSFTDAAQQLECSVGSVSKLVAQAEKILGFQIFSRTTRRVCITPAGATLVEIIEEYQRNILKLLQTYGIDDLRDAKISESILDICGSYTKQNVAQTLAEKLKQASASNVFNQETLAYVVGFLLRELYLDEEVVRNLLKDLMPGCKLKWLKSMDIEVIMGNEHHTVLASGLWNDDARSRFTNLLITELSSI